MHKCIAGRACACPLDNAEVEEKEGEDRAGVLLNQGTTPLPRGMPGLTVVVLRPAVGCSSRRNLGTPARPCLPVPENETDKRERGWAYKAQTKSLDRKRE